MVNLEQQLHALGLELNHCDLGTHRAPCPQCNRGAQDRKRNVAVTVFGDGHAVGTVTAAAGRAARIPKHSLPTTRWRMRDPAAPHTWPDNRSAKRAAAVVARGLWRRATPAPAAHPYIDRKRLAQAGLRHLARFQDLHNVVVVPMRNRAGRIVSLQGIDASGAKRFLAGGQAKAAFALVDFERDRARSHFVVGEGFATVWGFVRLHPEFAGIAALSAGNMGAVGEMFKARYPRARMVAAADRDGAGLEAAAELMAETGCEIGLPPEGCNDFSDLYVTER